MPSTNLALRPFVKDVAAILAGATSPQSLVQRHRIGNRINKLPKVRGTDRFEPAARALAAARLSGCGVSNLRKFWKLADRFTLQEAAQLDARGVSWRDADRLRSKHIKTKIGKALTGRALKSFTYHPKRLGHLISEVSEPEARETRRSTASAMERADEAILFLAGVALRAAAEQSIRQDAHWRLFRLHRRATKLLSKINRLPNAPRPTRPKTS